MHQSKKRKLVKFLNHGWRWCFTLRFLVTEDYASNSDLYVITAIYSTGKKIYKAHLTAMNIINIPIKRKILLNYLLFLSKLSSFCR